MNYLNNVQQYKSDVAFKTLVEGINDNLYFIPKYQRQFRWKKKQVQELACSLVKGYPIPPIYAYRNDNGQLEILDGQQRIMSLFFYYIGRFLDKKKNSAIDFRKISIEGIKYRDFLEDNFTLVDLTTIYRDPVSMEEIDISYRALPVDVQRRVDYTTITVVELRWDQSEHRIIDIQRIFKNLNSNGTKLSQQEIRNGVYHCEFYEMLRTINEENEDWKQIRGRISDSEEDMEMLLRLCTVFHNVEYQHDKFLINRYHSNYSDWMDDFSEITLKMTENEVAYYKGILEDFFSHFQLNRVLGLRKALLEGLFVMVEIVGLNLTITDELIDDTKNADAYKDNSRQGTLKKNKMNERWRGMYEVLSRYAAGDSYIIK